MSEQALMDKPIELDPSSQYEYLQELYELETELARRLQTEQCLNSHLEFSKLMYPVIEGDDLIVAPHIIEMCNAADKVFRGEIDRLIVTLPPGYNKTKELVILFIAHGLAINPAARFIHASYSDKLVNENSTSIREAIRTDTYRNHWEVELKPDMNTKGLWRTDQGGGLLASPSGGSITGFRAGTLKEGFTGAMVIDDPLKPDDALSKTEREYINHRWHTTFKSRLAHEHIPVIILMQRLHMEDLAGYMLAGGAGYKWHHLYMPVYIDNEEPYPSEFAYGVPIKHNLKNGPLWSTKHNAKQIEELKLDKYTYAAQYAQRPIPAGGALFNEDMFHEYNEEDLPQLIYRKIFADTAQKTKTRSDYSVFQCWGKGKNGKVYLIDQLRGKFAADDLLRVAIAFWEKHRAIKHAHFGTLRSIAVEDKVSGTGLIQQLQRRAIPVQGIKRDTDKYQRGMDVVPSFAAGLVMIPRGAKWLLDWKLEMLAFDGSGNSHDDQVDPTIDAVTEMCLSGLSMADVL